MAMSVSILAAITSLHLIAFVFAVGAERRRSTSKIVADQYDERTFCVYDSDASTAYGLTAFGLLLISQVLVNSVTKCLCCGRAFMSNGKVLAVSFFVFSWVVFLGAEACLLAGSVENAYHTKYRGYFGKHDISCASLRKGVFAAGGAFSLLSLMGSILYYWAHVRADTGGWQKHRNEGIGMTTAASQDQPKNNEFEKV